MIGKPGLQTLATEPYPLSSAERNRWVVHRRSSRNLLDPWRPYAFSVEAEAGPDAEAVDVSTIFLTNRECPWRCVMCDLWRNTLETTVPDGAIAEQIRYALDRLPTGSPARSHLKLYNAGSFFDPGAIPPAEDASIARLAAPFARTIVECHPSLLGSRCLKFRDLLDGELEVAMGLETANPDVLERLNKRMTLDQFRRAAEFLKTEGIFLRVFILVRPPWLSEDEGVEWARRSLDFAFDCGASVCSLIPTRAGNGAMEALRNTGDFEPPSLDALERTMEYGLACRAGRVFVDLWDIDKFIHCSVCSQARIDRLREMNATQVVSARIECGCCA